MREHARAIVREASRPERRLTDRAPGSPQRHDAPDIPGAPDPVRSPLRTEAPVTVIEDLAERAVRLARLATAVHLAQAASAGRRNAPPRRLSDDRPDGAQQEIGS